MANLAEMREKFREVEVEVIEVKEPSSLQLSAETMEAIAIATDLGRAVDFLKRAEDLIAVILKKARERPSKLILPKGKLEGDLVQLGMEINDFLLEFDSSTEDSGSDGQEGLDQWLAAHPSGEA